MFLLNIATPATLRADIQSPLHSPSQEEIIE
jgi:hypothetical protein